MNTLDPRFGNLLHRLACRGCQGTFLVVGPRYQVVAALANGDIKLAYCVTCEIQKQIQIECRR